MINRNAVIQDARVNATAAGKEQPTPSDLDAIVESYRAIARGRLQAELFGERAAVYVGLSDSIVARVLNGVSGEEGDEEALVRSMWRGVHYANNVVTADDIAAARASAHVE